MTLIKVTASTLGQQNPSQATVSKPYRWRQNPDWYPGNPDYREDARAAPRKANADRIADREERKRKFSEHRAADVPVLEAGRRVGVTDKTAYAYERERLAALGEAQQP